MSELLDFARWARRGGPGDAPVGGRPSTKVEFELYDERHTVPTALHFAQPGPGDVRGLQAGAIRQVVPPPGDRDADEEHCPYVELATEDLPWRYGLTGGGDPRPWCVLVVGDPADVELLGDRARIGPVAQGAHLLDEARLSAHVQRARGAPAGSGFSRVLSRAVLEMEHDYVAALVIPWRADGSPAWPGADPVIVPCLHSWRFRTGEEGTFDDLALALHAADNDPVGTVRVHVRRPDGEHEITVPGALTTLGFEWERLTSGHPARDHEVLTDETDRQGRRYVQPPAYGEAWVTRGGVRDDVATAVTEPDAQWPWTAQANADLRMRVIAGVGLQAGIDLQEQIVDAADRQWGAGRWAADLVGSLALGTAVTDGLWRRAPDDQAALLALLGPAAHRVSVTDHPTATSLAGALADPGPGRAAYPVGLLGPQISRVVGRNAVRDAGGVGALQDRATEGLPTATSPHDEIAWGAEVDDIDAGHVAGLGHRTERDTGGAVTAQDVDDAMHRKLADLPIAREFEPVPPESLLPPRPAAVTEILVDALTNGSAGRRVIGRLEGHELEEPLAPLRDCPDLDLPAWPYLRDVVPHWLLPGAETLEPGEVVAMRTCPEFVEAFLLGLNHRALGELAWRQHPVSAGCTPLRRFWDAVPDDGDAATGEDVLPVKAWPDGSRLGSHAPPGVRAERLVVVVRSPLFRRYPRTLLFLAPQGSLGDWSRGDVRLDQPVMPRSVAAMSPDLTMFAFDEDPDVIQTHWVVVQEMPEGIRFLRTEPGADSATWAEANLDTPLRVLLPGPETVGVSQ